MYLVYFVTYLPGLHLTARCKPCASSTWVTGQRCPITSRSRSPVAVAVAVKVNVARQRQVNAQVNVKVNAQVNGLARSRPQAILRARVAPQLQTAHLARAR